MPSLLIPPWQPLTQSLSICRIVYFKLQSLANLFLNALLQNLIIYNRTYLAYIHLLTNKWKGNISLRKCKLDAKLEHQYINNYKELQNCMKKIRIEKVNKKEHNLKEMVICFRPFWLYGIRIQRFRYVSCYLKISIF